jgi:hypothetical protein
MGAGARAGWSSLIGAFERAFCCYLLFGYASCSCVRGKRCCGAGHGMACVRATWHIAWSLIWGIWEAWDGRFYIVVRCFAGYGRIWSCLFGRDSIVSEMANWIDIKCHHGRYGSSLVVIVNLLLRTRD